MNNPALSLKLFHRIEELKGRITANYIELGKILCAIRDGRLYKYAGSHITNMDDFLIEMRLGRSTGYNLMQVYEVFGQELEAEPLDIEYTRLVRALPVAVEMDIKAKDRLLTDAVNLPPRAYEDAIRELKGQTASDNCEHTEQEAWTKCRTCGRMWKL